MTFRQLIVTSSAGMLMFWGCLWAQQSPAPAPGAAASTESPSPSSSTAQTDTGKEKHWSGSLVDIPCLVKALSNKSEGTGTEGGAGTGAPQFMGSGFTGQAGQQSGAPVSPGGQTPGQGQGQGQGQGTSPSFPNQQGAQNPNTTPAQQAQMARAERIDKAAKECPASASTQQFGLAMSGGQVAKFDNDGNSKAQDALKEVEVKPGKSIKAKVTGALQDKQTIRVASVEVKGKRAGKASGAGQ